MCVINRKALPIRTPRNNKGQVSNTIDLAKHAVQYTWERIVVVLGHFLSLDA